MTNDFTSSGLHLEIFFVIVCNISPGKSYHRSFWHSILSFPFDIRVWHSIWHLLFSKLGHPIGHPICALTFSLAHLSAVFYLTFFSSHMYPTFFVAFYLVYLGGEHSELEVVARVRRGTLRSIACSWSPAKTKWRGHLHLTRQTWSSAMLGCRDFATNRAQN